MLLETKELYNDRILLRFLDCYDIDRETVKFLGDSDSYVYEFRKNDESFIMKITHSNRRTVDYLQGEIDWLNYLAKNGANVARAVPSMHGNLVEILQENNTYFLASIYEKVSGHLPTESDWNSQMFEDWGRATGKLHALTKTYSIKNEAWKLINWYEEEFVNVDKYIPPDERVVIQKSNELMTRLKKIPKNKENYGLIHGDLQYHNFNLNDKGIVLFDFDDVAYNFFVNDLAVILFHAYWTPLKEHSDKHLFVEEFLNSFLRGYNLENHFQAEWFVYIADFLKARHLIRYICYFQHFDIHSLSKAETDDFEMLKKVIEEGWTIIDFDFVEYSKGI